MEKHFSRDGALIGLMNEMLPLLSNLRAVLKVLSLCCRVLVLRRTQNSVFYLSFPLLSASFILYTSFIPLFLEVIRLM